MILKVRLDDALGERLDASATALGVTRSQFARTAIEGALANKKELTAPSVRPVSRAGEPSVLVHFRVPKSAIEAVDLTAAKLGMRRSDWMRKRVVAGVLGSRGELRPTLNLADEMQRSVSQLRAIGVNLNQAVRAVNASAMPDSGMEMRTMVGILVRMRDEMDAIVADAAAQLGSLPSRDKINWTRT